MSITTSRRSFVKGAGAGIAAVAATSMISGVAFADDAKASEVKDGTYTVARFDQDGGRYSLLNGVCETMDGPYTFGTYLWAKFDHLDA